MAPSATLPVSPAVAPARSRFPAQWIDALLMLLVVVIAFLAGSFVARNSDLWLHLATGRLIAGGDHSFGVDPFSYSSAGRYWAHHSWLFDLGLFHLYQSAGGAALVVVKAGLVAAIAVVMLLMVRGRGPVWLTTGCLLLAILALAPRLLLQPTIASYLLLPLCLLCLERGGRALVAVPILIAIWVNLDAWFLLGPVLVGLMWIGQRIDPVRSSFPPWPTWLVPASLAACFLSPHHAFALTLPAELSPGVWASGISADPRFAAYFASPWQVAPLSGSGGYSLAAWSFVLLLGLGVLSFGLNPRALRSWRGPVWLAFGVLAAWQARLIPFFAVVGGPIAALNFGEIVPRTALARSGRAMVLFVSVALLATAWMGWLIGFRNRERAPAWDIHAEPSLERAATGITHWRWDNSMPASAKIFTTHPDLGHYLAWFAPGEQSSFDSRFTLFTDFYPDFARLSRSLGLLPEHESAADELDDWFSRHSIAAVALFDPDSRRMASSLGKVHQNDRIFWRVARIDGGAVLLVPATSHSVEGTFPAECRAFGPRSAKQVHPEGHGPTQLVEQSPFRALHRSAGRRGSAEADAATIYLRLFEVRTAQQQKMNVPVPALLGERSADLIRLYYSSARSPALPLLAIRSARRGVEIDPGDPTAWFMLGGAYTLLEQATWERDAGAPLTLLSQLRGVQATTALLQAAILSPDSLAAHQALARAYLGQGALDLAHRHAVEALRILHRSGPAPGETREEFDERAARFSEFAGRIEAGVLDGENRYLVRTAGLAGEPLSRARIAHELGLVQKAIAVLIESHPDLYGPDGIRFLIELLLQTGQIPAARALLERQEIQRNPGALGLTQVPGRPHPDGHSWSYRFPAYAWLSLSLAIGAGQYDRARTLIGDLCDETARQEQALQPLAAIELAKAMAMEMGLAVPPGAIFNRFHPAQAKEAQAELWRHTHLLSVHRADLLTIAGVIELECGNPAGAQERFTSALEFFERNRPFAPALPGLPLAKRYLEALESQHRKSRECQP